MPVLELEKSYKLDKRLGVPQRIEMQWKLCPAQGMNLNYCTHSQSLYKWSP